MNERRIPFVLATGTVVVVLALLGLFAHARGKTNDVALASRPKGVTAVLAEAAQFRPQRRYVGTLEPWVSARVGPQLVSAYVATVLVRPGARVRRGDVLATLDCRNASAQSRALEQQARALEHTQKALSAEAARVGTLLGGGFVSPDEVEKKQAESESKQAQLLALQAQVLGSGLQVADCVLRAPFDGEVAERSADPGTFARPGAAVVTLVDRSTVRLSADVPEADFAAVEPGSPLRVHVLATGQELTGKISRRAPAADAATRTVHVEADLPNEARTLPVGTTAELRLDVGVPQPASRVPLLAAAVRGSKATVFVVENDVAHSRSVPVLGEREGQLFLDPRLAPGTAVVTQGRTGLAEGDKVQAQVGTPTLAREGQLQSGAAR